MTCNSPTHSRKAALSWRPAGLLALTLEFLGGRYRRAVSIAGRVAGARMTTPIGKYKLVRLIASGGMGGGWYLGPPGRRRRGFEKLVCLKRILPPPRAANSASSWRCSSNESAGAGRPPRPRTHPNIRQHLRTWAKAERQLLHRHGVHRRAVPCAPVGESAAPAPSGEKRLPIAEVVKIVSMGRAAGGLHHAHEGSRRRPANRWDWCTGTSRRTTSSSTATGGGESRRLRASPRPANSSGKTRTGRPEGQGPRTCLRSSCAEIRWTAAPTSFRPGASCSTRCSRDRGLGRRQRRVADSGGS